MPLLRPEFVGRMIELSADYDVAVPHVAGHDEPLAAVYRTETLPQIERLLAEDRLRPALLFDRVGTRRVLPEELTDVDPDLASLMNVNTPEQYRAALGRAGFDARH